MRLWLGCIALMTELVLASCGHPWEGSEMQATPDETGLLKARGTTIRAHDGLGRQVFLRGTNAGGWLIQEAWMNPTDAKDQRTMRTTLAARLGASTRDRLVAIYEDNYWTEADFQHCQDLGFNVLRLPFTYWNLEEEEGDLSPGAWTRLDWFVARAQAHGMYVILDLHGARGSQNGQDHSGDTSGANLWTSAAHQDATVVLWQRVAAHFRGNPAVAGYDLLNEPTAGPAGPTGGKTQKLQWDFYDRLYQAIREVDPDHMIILQSCWEPSDLPPPSRYRWENVAYEYHFYCWGHDTDVAAQLKFADDKVESVRKAGHPVPTLVGEFSGFSRLASWDGILQRYSAAGWSWTTWTYKVTGTANNWGLFNHTPPRVAIDTESEPSIAEKWGTVDQGMINSPLAKIVSWYAKRP